MFSADSLSKQCTHEKLEFMSQIIMGDPCYTRYWQQCQNCQLKLYEREQFHGHAWNGK